jgi:hypothetical protein
MGVYVCVCACAPWDQTQSILHSTQELCHLSEVPTPHVSFFWDNIANFVQADLKLTILLSLPPE